MVSRRVEQGLPSLHLDEISTSPQRLMGETKRISDHTGKRLELNISNILTADRDNITVVYCT